MWPRDTMKCTEAFFRMSVDQNTGPMAAAMIKARAGHQCEAAKSVQAMPGYNQTIDLEGAPPTGLALALDAGNLNDFRFCDGRLDIHRIKWRTLREKFKSSAPFKWQLQQRAIAALQAEQERQRHLAARQLPLPHGNSISG